MEQLALRVKSRTAKVTGLNSAIEAPRVVFIFGQMQDYSCKTTHCAMSRFVADFSVTKVVLCENIVAKQIRQSSFCSGTGSSNPGWCVLMRY